MPRRQSSRLSRTRVTCGCRSAQPTTAACQSGRRRPARRGGAKRARRPPRAARALQVEREAVRREPCEARGERGRVRRVAQEVDARAAVVARDGDVPRFAVERRDVVDDVPDPAHVRARRDELGELLVDLRRLAVARRRRSRRRRPRGPTRSILDLSRLGEAATRPAGSVSMCTAFAMVRLALLRVSGVYVARRAPTNDPNSSSTLTKRVRLDDRQRRHVDRTTRRATAAARRASSSTPSAAAAAAAARSVLPWGNLTDRNQHTLSSARARRILVPRASRAPTSGVHKPITKRSRDSKLAAFGMIIRCDRRCAQRARRAERTTPLIGVVSRSQVGTWRMEALAVHAHQRDTRHDRDAIRRAAAPADALAGGRQSHPARAAAIHALCDPRLSRRTKRARKARPSTLEQNG